MQEYLDFKVESVPLEGKNLVEASAGTGKTYSIAMMVIRILLEKEIRINEILMVTFTKAAVAELEDRIRSFVRQAYRYANGEHIEDSTIQSIVDSVDREFAQKKLHSALINLDETAVMTIHGFCQQSLNEFAFETNQLFTAELTQDTAELLEKATHQFWREYITALSPTLLTALTEAKLNLKHIQDLAASHISGKLFLHYDETQTYDFDHLQNQITSDFQTILNKRNEELEELYTYIENNQEALITQCLQNKSAVTTFKDSISVPKEFVAKLMKGTQKYREKCFPTVMEMIGDYQNIEQEYEEQLDAVFNYIYGLALQEIVAEVEEKKLRLNLMTFDDMIEKLHYALNHPYQKPAQQRLQADLIKQLQRKFKAVFIDEFQDTDHLQYHIFNTAFQRNILFFIGDPKQSIYGWRKADIATYFEAKNNVDRVYSMSVNYRSSTNLVSALNHFFKPSNDFDTFYYPSDSVGKIDYLAVHTPPQNTKGELTLAGKPCIPVTYNIQKNKSDIHREVGLQISELLNNADYLLKGRRIQPSDIGILVRSNYDAAEIKKELSKIGIPAITMDSQKVLQSAEAKELLYILEAILHHNRSTVNRALLSAFTRWTPSEILRMDEDSVIEKFRNYFQKWQQSGIYAALSDFLSGFQIRQNLIEKNTENGERMMTNFYHLMEVLNKTENRQKFGPAELTEWFQINTEKDFSTEDEMEQRIESDEESVKIVTIHKSKGLEYPIVFAPTLDFTTKISRNSQDKIIGIREENGKYVSIPYKKAPKDFIDKYELQTEQENRRLLYVALTRAVYKCFIYHSSGKKKSTLTVFLAANQENPKPELIAETKDLETENPKGYQKAQSAEQRNLQAQHFKLKQPFWTQTSYSNLAAEAEYIRREAFASSPNSYDTFVFKELTKGAKTGNFIHHLFESIDFSNDQYWEDTISKAIRRYAPHKAEAYTANIKAFLDQVLHTSIRVQNGSFRLSEVSYASILHEMEFDFPFDLLQVKNLEKLKKEGIAVKHESYISLEGIMTGFVDVFFKHRGKFYILDWKTNYLGPTTADYSPQAVAQAMSDNNYHLQYLIYIYAINLYLQHRLGKNYSYERDFGGVIYLFVRGMRKNQHTGIFYTKPKVEQLQMMEGFFKKDKVGS